MAHKWKGRERIERTEWKRIHGGWYNYLYIMNVFETNLLNSLWLIYYSPYMKKEEKKRKEDDLQTWSLVELNFILDIRSWMCIKPYLLYVLFVLNLWFVCAKPHLKFYGCSSFWIFEFDCSNTSSKLCRLIPFFSCFS